MKNSCYDCGIVRMSSVIAAKHDCAKYKKKWQSKGSYLTANDGFHRQHTPRTARNEQTNF